MKVTVEFSEAEKQMLTAMECVVSSLRIINRYGDEIDVSLAVWKDEYVYGQLTNVLEHFLMRVFQDFGMGNACNVIERVLVDGYSIQDAVIAEVVDLPTSVIGDGS